MEKEFKIKNAQQAKEISDKNLKDVEYYLGQVEANAKYGTRRVVVIDYMADNVFLDLSKLGFKMSKKTGHLGEDLTVIEW